MIMTVMYSKIKNILKAGFALMLTFFYLPFAQAGYIENAQKYFPEEMFDTLFVENNLDDGEGSLRQAILNANEHIGFNFIVISLLQDSDSVLLVKSPLPNLETNIRISMLDPNRKFIIDGDSLSNSSDHGLRIMADSVYISGLQIRNFPGYGLLCLSSYKNIFIGNNIIEQNGRLSEFGDGIFIQHADSIMIRSNLIRNNQQAGIELNNCSNVQILGNEITGNQGDGIIFFLCDTVMIGDTCLDCGNLVHSNGQSGISLKECYEDIRIFDNIVGMNRETTLAFPNGQHGLLVNRCKNVFVGDQDKGNFFSGNMLCGISIIDSSTFIHIRDNKIGYTKFSYFGIPNRQKGIEVLNSFEIMIGGFQFPDGNFIGYSPVNIFVGDESEKVSILNNSFFCSPYAILIEQNSNGGLMADTEFDIHHARMISGQFLPGGYVQIYRKRPECTTCQGSDLLATVQSGLTGLWEVLLDQPLHHGDVVTVLLTDSTGNSTGFSQCKQFNCIPTRQVKILSEGTDRICEGDELVLSTDFGILHQWNTGETNAQIKIDTEGWFSVSVIDPKGCSTSDSIFIQMFPRPSLTMYPSDSAYFCEESTIIRAFGQGAFLWNTGVSGPVLEISNEGTYCVSLTNQFQCVSTACVHMMKGVPVEADLLFLGNPIFCEGDSVILIAVGGTNFSWSTGVQDTDRITVYEDGIYQVTVSNEDGCIDVVSQDVETLPGVEASIDQPEYVEICYGDTITLTASGGSQFLWSNGSTSNQIRVHKLGVFDVRVMNEYGCSDKASCIVSILPPFQATLTDNEFELCTGDSILVQTQGSGLDSLVWSHGQKGNLVGFDSTGMYSVSLFKYGCSLEQSIFVHVKDKPVIDSISGPEWVETGAFAEYEVEPKRDGSVYYWRLTGGRVIDESKPGWVLVEWFGDPGANICVTELAETGCLGEEKCLEVQIISDSKQIGNQEWIKFYPNPAKKVVFVEISEEIVSKNLQIRFFTPEGKMIKTIQPENTGKRFSIDIAELLPGLYQLHISEGKVWEKWVKLVILE